MASVSAEATGLDRVPQNVLSSWGWHLVVVIAGLVLPRYVDGHLGQSALGVWDFGWSVVGYFGLAQVGIGSSVNRYVARYRAEQDIGRLNRAVSSVMIMQLGAAGVVLLVTGLCAWLVPGLLSAHLGPFVAEARWVLLFLGTSIALQIAFDTYDGILTGCHRWDLHNFLNAGFYGASVAAMLIGMALGGGLRSMAMLYCCGVALTGIARIRLAHRVCPGLRIRLRSADWTEAWDMFSFGGKTFIGAISGRLLYQTNSILIVSFLGPAALALYSRPMALAQHVGIFVSKFAYVLTPIASHMDAAGARGDVRRLLSQTTRYSAFLTLPAILVLIILGGPILRLWMGDHYEHGVLLAVLAVGHLLSFAHRPVLSLLTGTGEHGRPALWTLLAATSSAAMCLVALGALGGGLLGAAASVSMPLILLDGIIIPAYACRKLGLRLGSFLLSTWSSPALYALPFAGCLIASRVFLGPAAAVTVGVIGGGLLLTGMYWRWVMPPRVRHQIRGWLSRPSREGTAGVAEGA